jgi:hypothetical protein
MPQDGLSVVAVNDDPADSPGCVLCYWNDGGNGWSGADSTPVWTYDPLGGPGDSDFYSVAISGDGDYIATGPTGGSYVFSSASSVPLQTFSMGTGNSYDLTYDGQFGACGNRQGKLYYFSKDSSTTLWSKTLGGNVHTVSLASGSGWEHTVGSKWESGEPVECPDWCSWDLSFELTTDQGPEWDPNCP